MCDNMVDTHVSNGNGKGGTIKAKCGDVYLSHMGYATVARCDLCKAINARKKAASKVVIIEHEEGGASFKGALPAGMGL